jgi:hypothetical protein
METWFVDDRQLSREGDAALGTFSGRFGNRISEHQKKLWRRIPALDYRAFLIQKLERMD